MERTLWLERREDSSRRDLGTRLEGLQKPNEWQCAGAAFPMPAPARKQTREGTRGRSSGKRTAGRVSTPAPGPPLRSLWPWTDPGPRFPVYHKGIATSGWPPHKMSAILWFTKNIYYCLCLLFLAHKPQNLWNFLSDRSNGRIFGYSTWSPVLSSWNRFWAIKVNWVSCYS